MNLRPLLIGLPILLTGCSALSNFSWSSLSPTNWFGSSLRVTEQGVGGITAATAMNQDAINEGLNGDYRLRSGMAGNGDRLISFYQAMKDDQVKLIVSGQSKGTVERIDVMDKNISSQWGVKLDTPFSDIFKQAYGACQKGTGDDAEGVECVAPESQHVSYLLTGIWHGPEGLMPSDDALKSWKVSKIIWRAQAH
ncbi:RpoE-regulated lipoprotein [Yersinia nurmii]|uniref:RpoE-regulated lipoprotein n=1 Tax=Yersinia nurmii TaxID=685706 RepID=A0AAW7K8F0_9GAMM|nr:RpoE-regulated lipoprotein [Yersinia nurmii]MDN0087466.1 RpoE-regulated lipoprotein [Yersinia nurmii]